MQKQRSNCQHSLNPRESMGIPGKKKNKKTKKHLFLLHWLSKENSEDYLKKMQKKQRSSQHSLNHRESMGIPEIKHLFLLHWLSRAIDCVDHNKLRKILKEMGIPDHLTFLLRNLYVGQEATVRTGHWTKLVPWTKTGLFQNWERNMTRLYIVTTFI